MGGKCLDTIGAGLDRILWNNFCGYAGERHSAFDFSVTGTALDALIDGKDIVISRT